MPTLLKHGTLGNIAIRVFFYDTQKHRQPHFHAVGPDDSMVVSLPDLTIIEGDVNNKADILEWARNNLSNLISELDRCNPNLCVRQP